jgi:hypothetical protein
MGLVKALLVFGFVGLGLVAAYLPRTDRSRRRLVNLYIVYTLVLGLGAGLPVYEVWPFSTWPLVAGRVTPTITQPRVVAIDAAGQEYPIDYRAWGPFVYEELMAWEDKYFARLDRAAKDRVGAFLLGIIEQNRQQWAAGKPVLHFERYLGPLSAPLFLGHPEHWTKGAGVPFQPFRGLRFYKESWNVEERWRDPSKVSRTLTYEYREP